MPETCDAQLLELRVRHFRHYLRAYAVGGEGELSWIRQRRHPWQHASWARGTSSLSLHRPLLPCNATHLAVYIILEHQPLVVIRPFMTKLGAASVVDESHHIIHRPLVLQTPPPTRSVKGTVTARDESEPNVMAAVRAHTVQRIWQLNCSTLRDPSAGVRGGGLGLLREQHRLEQRSSADRSNIPGSVRTNCEVEAAGCVAKGGWTDGRSVWYVSLCSMAAAGQQQSPQ